MSRNSLANAGRWSPASPVYTALTLSPCHFQTIADMQRSSVSPEQPFLHGNWMNERKAAWLATHFFVLLHAAACACIVHQGLPGWVVWGYFSLEGPSDYQAGPAPEEITWSVSLLCGWRSLPFSDRLLSVFPVTLSLFLWNIQRVLDSSYDNCSQFDDILAIFAYFCIYTCYISDHLLLHF